MPALAAGNTVFIVGKRGVGYLLDGARLGGIGGQLAEQKPSAPPSAPRRSGGSTRVRAVPGRQPDRRRGKRGEQDDQGALARAPVASNGSPTLGGSAVWVTAYSDTSGTLYELNPATGAVRQRIPIGTGLPHFSSLSLAAGTAYVATLHGVAAISGA